MSNNFPPTVDVQGANVEIGSSKLLGNMFTVSDVDPDSEVLRIRFRDSNTAPTSGYFFNNTTGQAYGQGQVIEINYSDLYQISYQSAPDVNSELISVEAFDGLYWSDPGSGTVATVLPNVNPPVVTVSNFDVVATEYIAIQPFVEASDPDGYPIEEYLFINRSTDVNGGALVFDGTVMPGATWFSVAPEDLGKLEYRSALYAKGETISVRARDEAAWSAVADMVGFTKANVFNPMVQAFETELVLGQSIGAAQLFSFEDLDPNTMKRVGFTDEGVASSSGYFTVNGVKQVAGTMFWVDAADLNTVAYNAATQVSLEQFTVQAFDGQRLSAVRAANITSVDAPFIQTNAELQMIDSLEQIQLASLVNVSSGNLSPLYYEVIDMNPASTSAKLVVNGEALDAGEIHRIEATDWNLVFVQGGLDDLGRSLDEFNVRVDDGQHLSPWAGVNFSTDPVNQRSLIEIGHWQTPPTGPLQLTFNFPSVVPAYYCSLGFDQCGSFEPITDAGIRAGIRSMLETYEDMFNIEFTEVSSGVLSDIPFSMDTEGPGGAAAYAYAPGSPGIPGQFSFGGDIWGVKSAESALLQAAPGQVGHEIWAHEQGHSLGLNHPFGPETPNLPPAIDNNRFTIMSYTTVLANPSPETPMLYDTQALQTMYGANPNFRAGNTQIKFDKSQTNPQIVYDSGGIDTFNLNNHTINSTIDLRQGQFSTVTGVDQNVGIAWGTVIENARGGRGNDNIIGNDGNNSIIGNLGSDVLQGNGGIDYLHGDEGNDVYEWAIGDGNDRINERFGAGRDALHIHLFDEYVFDDNGTDLLGGTTLEDNFEFLKVGGTFNDLEVRLTLDGIADNGRITVEDMGWGRNRVETLRLFDYEGVQIGPDISLRSIFDFASSAPTPFQITSNTSSYGNLAQPVV